MSVNEKINHFHNTLMNQVGDCFPIKNMKVTSDDSPWCNKKVKQIKRLKGHEFNKHRSSPKWFNLNTQYKSALVQAKKKYYKDIISDLKTSNPSQWYSKI